MEVDLWIRSRGCSNTARAYRAALIDLQRACGKTRPEQISRADVVTWVQAMRERGLAPATIQQRLAGVSSLYRFLATDLDMAVANPTVISSNLRPRVTRYGKAFSLGAEEAAALLAVIDRETVIGARDYALYLGYLMTGRRNSEWRTLQWGAIDPTEERIYYRWSGKGHVDQRQELPRVVWAAIETALRLQGRWGRMQSGDALFTPIGGREPLSMREVQKRLKFYARLAGLDPRLRVHTLRHTAATLRRSDGADVEEIQQFLTHSSLAITQVYLHTTEIARDTRQSAVAMMLGAFR